VLPSPLEREELFSLFIRDFLMALYANHIPSWIPKAHWLNLSEAEWLESLEYSQCWEML